MRRPESDMGSCECFVIWLLFGAFTVIGWVSSIVDGIVCDNLLSVGVSVSKVW